MQIALERAPNDRLTSFAEWPIEQITAHCRRRQRQTNRCFVSSPTVQAPTLQTVCKAAASDLAKERVRKREPTISAPQRRPLQTACSMVWYGRQTPFCMARPFLHTNPPCATAAVACLWQSSLFGGKAVKNSIDFSLPFSRCSRCVLASLRDGVFLSLELRLIHHLFDHFLAQDQTDPMKNRCIYCKQLQA